MEKCDKTRRLLDHCRDAIDEIDREEPTGPTWERRWASMITLLRTTSETLEREAPTWWKNKIATPNAHVKGRDPKKDWSPDIFGKFIWTDANLFLHEGDITTGQSAMVLLVGVAAQGIAAGEESRPETPPPSPPRKAVISYHMNTGHYVGRDPRDVSREAIDWLKEQVVGAEAAP